MKEYIPSKEQREYFKEVGFDFTDFQKASIIWNVAHYTLEEQLLALEELSNSTNDTELKKQIAERIEYERKALEVFKENSETKNIYIIEYIEYFDNHYEHINEDFFFNFDDALDYSKKLIEKEISKDKVDSIEIDKYEISTEKKHIENKTYIDNSYLGRVDLNMNGEIEYLWSNEYKDEYETQKNRFEDVFYSFPLSPVFQSGTIVQPVDKKDIYIIASPYKEWDEDCNGIWAEKSDALDSFDIQITVYELTENGEWSHEHLNPLCLTTDVDWGDADSDYKEIIHKMSEYLSGDKSVESEVLRLSRKYADRSFKTKVYSAKKLSDIMF